MAKTLCIFHSSCYDGFAAAWVVRKYYGEANVEFHPGVYGEAAPDCTDRQVVMVDFAYPRATMERIAEQAQSLVVFDHHDSNRDMLESLKAMTVFDKKRSGAGITWDALFDGQPRPLLLDRIEDRDTWTFKYNDSRLIHAALESYPMTFATWDTLMERHLLNLAEEGVRLEALHWNHIKMLLPITKRLMRIGGNVVPVSNVPITLCSDVGIELAKECEHQYAATYMDTVLGRQFSLRSLPDGPNVSTIAAHYGKLFGTSGGGHPHAAGFLAPRGWEGDEKVAEVTVEPSKIGAPGA